MKEQYPQLYSNLTKIPDAFVNDENFEIRFEGHPEVVLDSDYKPPDGDYEDLTKRYVDSGAEYSKNEEPNDVRKPKKIKHKS